MESNKELKQRNLYEFFKYIAIGFTIVSFLVSIAVVGYIYVLTKNQPTNQINKNISPTISQSITPN